FLSLICHHSPVSSYYLFTDTSNSVLYTLSLHDALPILLLQGCVAAAVVGTAAVGTKAATDPRSVGTQVDDGTLEVRVNCALSKEDRKSTRLNSSHVSISYAVFCLN